MKHKDRILIIEDEKLIRWSLREKLQEQGYVVREAETSKEAFLLMEEDEFDLLLLDYRLPDATGLEILERVKKEIPEVSVVMMTAYGTVETAVQAMKLGAFDYLAKPVNLDEVVLVVEKALETTRLRREVRRLRNERRETHGQVPVIGHSGSMKKIMELVDKIVASPVATTILLEGDSGTGKNQIAKAIHYGSPRGEKPFVTITCTAITETLLESELFGHERGAFTDAKTQKKGLLEVADGGTAFLDEIGDMGPSLQAKLLRFLEDKAFKRVGGTRDIQVDVRVIAATNKNLEKAVESGSFREDLFYRLKVIPIELPPLRQRQEDIPLLVAHFLDHFNREFRKNTAGFTDAAMQCLLHHPWPGNIRELKNVIERIMILEDKPYFDVGDLSESVQRAASPQHKAGTGAGVATFQVGNMTLDDMEKEAIREALEKTRNNQVRAAQLLGVTRDTLRYRMKKYGLTEGSGRKEEDVGSPVSPS